MRSGNVPSEAFNALYPRIAELLPILNRLNSLPGLSFGLRGLLHPRAETLVPHVVDAQRFAFRICPDFSGIAVTWNLGSLDCLIAVSVCGPTLVHCNGRRR